MSSQKKKKKEEQIKLIWTLVSTASLLVLFVIGLYFLQEKLEEKEIEKEGEYWKGVWKMEEMIEENQLKYHQFCLDNSWEKAVFFGVDTICSRHVPHESGLGTEVEYSGIIKMAEE